MTETTTTRYRDRLPSIGQLTAGLLIIVAIGLGGLNLVVSHVLLHTMPLAIGLAAILYLVLSHRPGTMTRRTVRQAWQTDTDTVRLSFGLGRTLPIAVNLGVGLMTLVAVLMNGRSLIFYGLAIITFATLLVTIVFTDDDDLWPALLLTQILGFAFVLRFAALTTTPSWIGVDIWLHMGYVQQLIETASVNQGLGRSKYSVAPIYHLAVTGAALLTGLSARGGLYLSVGIALPISIALVYTVATRFMASRWALFAAAVYSITDFSILWGLHLIPTSLGVVFFLGLVAALGQSLSANRPPTQGTVILVVVYILSITFTHQVSAFITAVFLGSGALVQMMLRLNLMNRLRYVAGMAESEQGYIANLTGYFAFMCGLVVFNWSITPWHGQNFIESVVTIFIDAVRGSGVGSRAQSAETASTAAEIVPYIDYIGLVVLLFAVVVAGLYILDRSARQLELTLLVASAVMLAFTLIPPMFGLRNLLPGRWFAFLYVPLALLAAAGFAVMETKGHPAVFVAVAIVFIAIVPGSMILTTDATPDNPVFDHQEPRFAYTGTELSGMETVEAITADDTAVAADYPFVSDGNHYTGVDQYTGMALPSDPDTPAQVSGGHAWHVYRDYQSTGAPSVNNEDGGGTHIRAVHRQGVCSDTDHIAYTNSDVELCGTPS